MILCRREDNIMTARIYFKFEFEEDWEKFINDKDMFDTEDGQKHSIAECQNHFGCEIYERGISISRENLDILIYEDMDNEELSFFLKTYAMTCVKNDGIILADNYDEETGTNFEWYYLGLSIHEDTRTEYDDLEEHMNTDISDCEKWLGERRLRSLTYFESSRLYGLKCPRKGRVTDVEKAVLKRIIEKREEKKTLRDIFPDMNKELDNGLVIENGVCIDYEEFQNKYLGIETRTIESLEDVDDAEWFFPAEVIELGEKNDIFFWNPLQNINNVVFTTNLRRIQPELFKCRGFKHLYFIDPETEEILFHSEKFYNEDKDDGLCYDDLWNEFCERYNSESFIKSPAAALANPWFYDPEVNTWSDSMDWQNYLDRLFADVSADETDPEDTVPDPDMSAANGSEIENEVSTDLSYQQRSQDKDLSDSEGESDKALETPEESDAETETGDNLNNTADEKMHLIDIFPNLNRNAEDRLKVYGDGICYGYEDYQYELLGTRFKEWYYMGVLWYVHEISWYFPARIKEITDDFLFDRDSDDILVFTTNLKKIESDIFYCRGFRHIYIIDPETEEVLFDSEKFRQPNEFDKLCNLDLWKEFVKEYNEDQYKAMNNPKYYEF